MFFSCTIDALQIRYDDNMLTLWIQYPYQQREVKLHKLINSCKKHQAGHVVLCIVV